MKNVWKASSKHLPSLYKQISLQFSTLDLQFKLRKQIIITKILHLLGLDLLVLVVSCDILIQLVRERSKNALVLLHLRRAFSNEFILDLLDVELLLCDGQFLFLDFLSFQVIGRLVLLLCILCLLGYFKIDLCPQLPNFLTEYFRLGRLLLKLETLGEEGLLTNGCRLFVEFFLEFRQCHVLQQLHRVECHVVLLGNIVLGGASGLDHFKDHKWMLRRLQHCQCFSDQDQIAD